MVNIQYQPSIDYLGTEDGRTYTVYQSLPDNDEDGLHGRKS